MDSHARTWTFRNRRGHGTITRTVVASGILIEEERAGLPTVYYAIDRQGRRSPPHTRAAAERWLGLPQQQA